MEDNGDDVCYSTVNIKNGKPPSKENEDVTVYSEVNRKKTAPAETSQAEKEPAALCHSGQLLVCLGILCALLVVSIGVIIHLSQKMTNQRENIINLNKENEQLTEERKMMENHSKQLSRERDELNRTLGFILKFDNFPVKDFCPDKKWQPCQKGWIIFREKCYLFYNEMPPWKTWIQSREFCQKKHADLVVIDDLLEQEFVSNHTNYYYSTNHGYWLGLQKMNNTWIWIDGHEDTLRFWIKEVLGIPGPYGLLIPGRNLAESWNKAENVFQNKFICEHEALIWSV